MRGRLHERKWPWLAALAVAGTTGDALAQARYRRIEEPQWLKLNVTEVSTGIYSEGSYEYTTFNDSGTKVTHDRLFVGPLLGLNFDGSIYHPNFVKFMVNSEGSLGWGTENLNSGTSVHRDELQYLGRFLGSANILMNKPYNGNIFGSYDHTYQDFDFFNRAIVDSWRYGAQASYKEDPLSLTASYAHRDEKVSGDVVPTITDEDVFTANGRYDRDSGGTFLGYSLTEYTRTDFGRVGVGHDQSFTVGDSERFGSRNQHRLQAGGGYLRRDSDDLSSEEVTAYANFNAEHSRDLSSIYDFNYSHYDSEALTTDNYSGEARLRHQLYDSLTSTLIAQASDYEASSPFADGYTRRYAGGIGGNYTKRLSETSRLHVNNTFMLEHVDQKNIGTVENERHTFAGVGGGAPPDSFFLNQPNVVEATIEVTDQNDTQPPYLRGLDYGVVRNGSRTLIQRIPGSRIPAGALVLVDYQALPTPAGSYEGLSDNFSIRLDLFNRLWGIYGRINLYVNNAPIEMRVQDLRSYAVGTDLNWRWLRLGAEYEIYDSSQSSYRSARLLQGVSFVLDEESTLGADFTETWTDFVDAGRQEQDYRFIAVYRRALSTRLGLIVEGGVDVRRGPGVDQTLGTFRPSIEYRIGRTTVKAEYDFEYEMYLNNEERFKHLFYVRAKRVF